MTCFINTLTANSQTIFIKYCTIVSINIFGHSNARKIILLLIKSTIKSKYKYGNYNQGLQPLIM